MTTAIAEKTKKEGLLGAFPRFVTMTDLENPLSFEKEFIHLDGHRQQLGSTVTGELLRQAQRTYQADPSDEAFVDVLAAAIKYHAITDGGGFPPIVKFRADIVNLMRNAFKGRFHPFARAILERGLAEARDSLAQVVAAEDSRCRSLTGKDGQQAGPIVAAASRPVQELERRLQQLDLQHGNLRYAISDFILFLRARLAESDARDGRVVQLTS